MICGAEIEHVVTERRVLEHNTSPFLTSLKFSFQTPEKLYFLLDYVAGGELFIHLQREEVFSERRCRFYTSMLVMALDHLHKFNIIYRDMKPENILMCMNGYIKVTDFGLCKEIQPHGGGATHTFCGTPEYMAPEVSWVCDVPARPLHCPLASLVEYAEAERCFYHADRRIWHGRCFRC